MEGFPANIAANISTNVVKSGIHEACYLCCFNDIVEDFENKKEELVAKRDTVEENVRYARGRLEKISAEVEHWRNKAKKLIDEDTKTRKKCFYGWFPNCLWRYHQGKNLERKKQELIELIKGNFSTFSHPSKNLDIERFSLEDFVPFHSRKEAYNQLLEALKDGNRYMIGLHGMPGSGKTTLAIEVGNKVKELNLFDYVFMVVVSNVPNIVKKIQDQIASYLNIKWDKENEQDRANTLWKRLTNEDKILIILDDIWKWEELNFKEIGIPMATSKHKNCYALITTRDLEVCNKMGCQPIIKLEVLSENEAWTLFQHCANIDQNSSKTLKNKVQQIAKLCKGLPLAIVAIASILKNEEEKEWDVALRSLNKTVCNMDKNLERVYNPLDVSYYYFHSEAKELFKLCLMFPEDYEILVEDITTFGIGLGLCGEVNSYGDGRNIVGKSLKKLINSCLLSRVNEGEFVKMHDLVRDAAHWIAKKAIQVVIDLESLKALQEDASFKSTLKQLYCHSVSDLPEQLDYPKIEILILEWGFQLEPVTIPDTFFEGMRGLKVCVLKGYRYWQTIVLPKSIESLNNLRTLSLSEIILDNLYVLENLQSLKSLELKFCLINELPTKVEKLEKLKMLRLTNCNIQKNPFEVISKLSLEELYFVGNNWSYLEVSIKDATILSLQRYHIELEKKKSLQGSIDDSTSRALSIECFDGSPSNATMKKVVQEAEVLHLYQLQGGWATITPHFVGVTGEMNQLIELKLVSCSEIMFLIDAMVLSSPQETLFSNIAKLSLENMDNLKQLCHGLPPSNLFENLQELLIQECFQLNLRLFQENLNLCRLKILRIMECPKLTSLFTLSTARSLDLLEEFEIKICEALKYIIKEESDVGKGNEIVEEDDDDHQMRSFSLFPKLKKLVIDKCQQLEFILSIDSNLRNLNQCRLKIVNIKECPKLTSLFTLSNDESLDLLEELEIQECQALEHIIKEESGEGKGKELVKDYDDQRRYFSLFQKFKRLIIAGSQQLEQTVSVCSNKRWLTEHTLSLELQTVDSQQNWPFDITYCLLYQSMNLCHVKKMVLTKCEKLTSLFNLSIVPTMLLEELTIKRCHGLNHIITYEREGESHMNCCSIFPKLELLFVEDCNQLIYVMGEYHHEIHLSALDVFPALEELSLSNMLNIKTICQNNDQPRWSALRKLELIECPQFIITAVSDFMIYSDESHLDQLPVNEGLGTNMKQVHALDDLKVINSKIEGIICLEGKSVSHQEVSLGINSLYLHNVPDLSYTFSGPKRILSLPNLRALEFQGCGKLKFIFSTSVLRSLPLLERLYIVNCEALEQIVEDEYENQNNFQQVFFPHLEILNVINCRKLKRLFCMNTPYEFPKLWTLFILEASNLEEVFGSSKMGETEKQVENVLPDLKYLVLAELPSLANFCQWTKLQNVSDVFVLNCPKLPLTSTVTLQKMINNYEFFRDFNVDLGDDHRWGRFWMCNLALNELNRMKNHIQEELSIKETENDIVREVSPPEIPTYLSEATLLGQPEAVGESKSNTEIVERIVQETKNPSPAPLQKEFAQEFRGKQSRNEADQKSVKGNVQGSPMSLKLSMVTFATHDSESESSTLKERFEKSPEALEETNETPQRSDRPSNLLQNTFMQEMEGRASSNNRIITNEQGINGSGQRVSLTDSEPRTLINSQQEFEGKESMDAAISTEEGTLDENKINQEFPQIVAMPSDSDLVQNVEEHASASTPITILNKTAKAESLTIPEPKDSSLTPIDTSPEETSPLGPMRVSKTETSLDKDTNASFSSLQDLMHGIFSVLNSLEKDGEVQEPMSSISVIPSDRFNLEDQQLLVKAFADLEAYLKMPLKDIANSEVNSHCLENVLKFLSSWSCGNGAPWRGLKPR